MTDLEKIELALRRIADRAASNPIGYWMKELAGQIAADEAVRKRSAWTECPKCNNLTQRPSDGQCVACT